MPAAALGAALTTLCRALSALAAILACAATAEELSLVAPIDCGLERDCYIQQFVDHAPGPERRDFRCGAMANDGHKGTDFALPSLARMAAGVDVLAAAPGEVRRIRDGVADIAADAPDAPPIDGRDCGNGVVIDHGGGWETQYCHLRRGSLRVAPGDRVVTGTVLGRVGLSGATTYPHLHLSVRRDGAVVDPFAPEPGPGCAPPDRTLFADPPPSPPGGIVVAGFADHVPEYGAIKAGTAAAPALSARGPALVIWGHVFGGRKGDRIRLTVEGPSGAAIDRMVTLDAAQPRLFRAVGRRTPAEGWPAGRYGGSVTLLRNGREIDRETLTIDIE